MHCFKPDFVLLYFQIPFISLLVYPAKHDADKNIAYSPGQFWYIYSSLLLASSSLDSSGSCNPALAAALLLNSLGLSFSSAP